MSGDDQSPACQETSEEPELSSEMKVRQYWTMFLRQTRSDCWVYLYSHTNDLAGKTNAPHTHSPDVYIMQASCSPENCHQIQFFETLCQCLILSSDGGASWACTSQWTREHDCPIGEVSKKCEGENFFKNLLSGYRPFP